MGNRGKVEERAQARELRALSWTLQEIADELGVSKGSVSEWVRDVDFEPRPRNRGHPAGPKHPMRLKKEAELEQCRVEAEAWVGRLSNRDLSMYALALYAGEGSKRDGSVVFANSDPVLLRIFIAWLRREFAVDESKFRVKLYLHADLDVEAALQHWSALLDIPRAQFNKPYRAVVDPTLRHNRHVFGCASVVYHSRRLHRRVMARIAAIGSTLANPG
jgi:transcriptional regulator with XRE-family HTH domain